jgi:RNA:NAD 2'-phosphotransferase (TPT1/KptA family)
MRGVTFERIKEIVETNNKQRFTLLLEPPNASATTNVITTGVPVEIPHPTQVTIPALPGSDVPTDLEELIEAGGTWYIRANQGHTLKAR